LRRHGQTPLRSAYGFRWCGLSGLSRHSLAAFFRGGSAHMAGPTESRTRKF
jgi:hypothetical protein